MTAISENLTLGFLSSPSPELNAIFRRLMPASWRFVSSDGSADQPHFLAALPEIDYLVVSATKFRRDHIARATRLRFLHKLGVGYDDIETDGLVARGIPLAVTPIGTAESVAEHTLALTLAAMKSIVWLDNAMRQDRTWPKWESRSRLHRLAGRTVGIVGYGRVGQRVAGLFLAFGCKVLVHARTPPATADARVEFVDDLDTLFRDSSIVSLHVPLTDATRDLVTAHRLALLGPQGLLVNTARGAVVDEAALLAALATGQLGFAALDVLCQEPPPPDHPLLALPNVVMTPHIGGGGLDVLAVKAEFVVANILHHATGQAILEQIKLT